MVFRCEFRGKVLGHNNHLCSSLSALSAKESGAVGGAPVSGGAASSGGVMVVDIVKSDPDPAGDSEGRLPTPSKLKQLRYAGYSAEFLDRVEPNGNIPHKQIAGKWKSKSRCNRRSSVARDISSLARTDAEAISGGFLRGGRER